MTSAEFKKQVGKYYGEEMRKLGFKGSGLDYYTEIDNLLLAFTIGGAGKWWSGTCNVVMAVHPKVVTRDSEGSLNLDKLTFTNYEFRMSLCERDRKWDVGEQEEDNRKIINDIVSHIRTEGLQTFERFKLLLNSFEPSDLDRFWEVFREKTGLRSAITSEMRFAWVMALMNEETNPELARAFSQWGLNKLGKSRWFARKDWERIAKSGN